MGQYAIDVLMPQPSSCLHFKKFQPSKLLKGSLFVFTERRSPTSTKVKYLHI